MTAFLRAVKFIFNFCFYEVFRGVFQLFSPFPRRIQHRVKRGCNYCGSRDPGHLLCHRLQGLTFITQSPGDGLDWLRPVAPEVAFLLDKLVY